MKKIAIMFFMILLLMSVQGFAWEDRDSAPAISTKVWFDLNQGAWICHSLEHIERFLINGLSGNYYNVMQAKEMISEGLCEEVSLDKYAPYGIVLDYSKNKKLGAKTFVKIEYVRNGESIKGWTYFRWLTKNQIEIPPSTKPSSKQSSIIKRYSIACKQKAVYENIIAAEKADTSTSDFYEIAFQAIMTKGQCIPLNVGDEVSIKDEDTDGQYFLVYVESKNWSYWVPKWALE